MTDKDKTIKELKEVLDSLDITNEYRLNLIKAIEYLQEESASDDLDEEIRQQHRCFREIDMLVFEDIARHFAEWQRQKDSQLPKIRQRDTIDEYAYQVAYDLSNDWAKETPDWHDVETACKLGVEWKMKQMMKDAFYATCCGSHAFSACWCFDNIDTSNFYAGDRIKIVVIKEED